MDCLNRYWALGRGVGGRMLFAVRVTRNISGCSAVWLHGPPLPRAETRCARGQSCTGPEGERGVGTGKEKGFTTRGFGVFFYSFFTGTEGRHGSPFPLRVRERESPSRRQRARPSKNTVSRIVHDRARAPHRSLERPVRAGSGNY